MLIKSELIVDNIIETLVLQLLKFPRKNNTPIILSKYKGNGEKII